MKGNDNIMRNDLMFSIKDKVCVVTGGTGLLGSQFVKTLYDYGGKIAVWSRHSKKDNIKKIFAKDVIDDERLIFFNVDVTDRDSINEALDKMEQKWGEDPQVLINNAGIDTPPNASPEITCSFEDFPEDVFRNVINANLTSIFLTCQAVGKRMVQQGKGGTIVNVASIYGMVSPVQDIYAYKKEQTGIPFIKPIAYSASKSGIYNLTRYLATYWAKKGIRVNTLTPSGVINDTQDETFRENYVNRIPIGRMAEPDEFNGAVIFLASDASKYMTGANLVIDGGWTAW